MHHQHLQLLYAYNTWANARILDTAANLTADELHTSGIASFGSINDTAVHIVSAQWNWLERCRGHEARYLADPADYPDLAAIRARMQTVDAETEAFVAALDADGPARIVTYVNSRGQTWSYPLWQLLLHVANHGTQHRSEIAAMLTTFGHSPGWMDLTVFLNAAQEPK